MRCRHALLAATVAALLLPAASSAATLTPLASPGSWASTPIHASAPPGDPRVFVVERSGGIRIVKDGVLLSSPFLTVPNVDTFNERGLLSIAFPPDYASSGLFYVFTVAAGSDELDPTGMAGDIRVVEYRRSETDPDLADPASARLVLKETHGAGNHNGGQLAFGPEGLLYITIGDNATSANAQTTGNNLGKVLRIDPRDPDGAGLATFSIPESNPYTSIKGGKLAIYSIGLRNPYRASFAPNDDLIVADVGEGTWEEINVGRATGTPAATTLAGANLGWPTCEGTCVPTNPLFDDPFFQYPNAESPAESTGCAVLGGYVVRDQWLTGLTGRYLYGDLCRTDLRTLNLNAPGGDPQPAGLSLPQDAGELRGFGEDGRGCVYVMTTETAYRVAPSPDAGTICPPPPPPQPVADHDPPGLKLKQSRRQRLRRFVLIVATCDEACNLRASGGLRMSGAGASKAARLRLASRSGSAGVATQLRLRLPKSVFKRAKRARKDGRRVKAQVKVSATDPSGNATVASAGIVLR